MYNKGLLFSLPPKSLSGIVKGFWMHSGSGHQTVPQAVNIIACTGFGLIAPFKGGFYFRDENNLYKKYPNTFFVGIRTKNVELSIRGDYGLFGIVFHPQVYHHLKFTAPSDLIDCNQSITEVMGKEGVFFEDELFMASSFSKKIEVASKYLIARFNNLDVKPNKFDLFIDHIHDKFYHKSIDEMSNLCNMSTRHFNRNFKRTMGVNPKKYNRIIRFRKAIDFIASNHIQINFSSISYLFGYADQSHFINEFSEFAGTTPYKYFNKSTLDPKNKFMEEITSKYHN